MDDRLIYLNARTGIPLVEAFPDLERYQLKIGQVLRTYVRGEGNRFYKVVEIEDDYASKVYLRRIHLHWSDVIKLLVLAVVGWVVLKYILDFVFSLG